MGGVVILNMTLNKLTAILFYTDSDLTIFAFKEQYYTYLVQIVLVAPTAEFSAHPTDNSTTSGILQLGNHRLSPVPALRFLMVCSPS